MCDPLTIAGLALTAGSTVANTVANNNAEAARNDVLTAEHIRQTGLDQEAAALNSGSQDRYKDFGTQQDTKAQSLGDYFTGGATTAGEANIGSGAVLPSSTSSIVNQEEDKQLGKAKAFTDQQGAALGTLRSFGDMLGDTSRLQARDASAVGQIGGFKQGDAAVVPYTLDAASHAGDGFKTLADLLSGVGMVTSGAAAARNPTALSGMFGGAAPTVAASAAPTPATMSAALAAQRGVSLYPTSSMLGN